MDDIKAYVQDYIKSGKHINGLHKWIKSKPPRLEWLKFRTSFLPESSVYDQRLWHVVNEISVIPSCPICNNPAKWRKYNVGYDTTCGLRDCIEIRRSDIRSATNYEKYGHINAASSQLVKDKIKTTNQSRYGVDNVLSLDEIQSKIESTNIEKYGVRRPLQNMDIRAKQESTNISKYGSENPMHNRDIKSKVTNSHLEKWGVNRGSKLDDIKDKQKNTNEGLYGGNSPMHSSDVKRKAYASNVDKYGYGYAIQNPDVRQKAFNTMLERYGVKYPYEHNEFLEKAKRTWMSRYNVDNPNKSDQVLLHRKHQKLGQINADNPFNHIRVLDIVDRQKYEISCSVCGGINICYSIIFNARVSNMVDPCVKCNPIQDTTSEKHMAIAEYLKSLGISTHNNVRGFLIKSRELDIYSYDHNIGIEFNVLYWHSNNFKDDDDHVLKTDECESKNIHLIHIWEDQWDEKSDIVKGRLKSLFGISDIRYNARSLDVREVSSSEARAFLDSHHIQGAVNSSVRLGLYHGDELISLMTFGKLRKIMGRNDSPGCWEMLRFCSISGVIVRGGASKLLTAFKRLYPDWKMIISYADRSWSNGNLYEKLGFQYMGNTGPNTWFIENGRRIHRFRYTKKRLIAMGGDPTKTSREIATELGLTWICDSGSRRYILHNSEIASNKD